MATFEIIPIPPGDNKNGGRYRSYPRKGKYDEYFSAIASLKHNFEFVAIVPNKQSADSISTGIQQKDFRKKYKTGLMDDEYYATHKEPLNANRNGEWKIFVRIASRDQKQPLLPELF